MSRSEDILLELVVTGQPATAGSKRAYPIQRRDGSLGVAVVNDCRRAREWMRMLALLARRRYTGAPAEGPLRLIVRIDRARPRSHLRRNGAVRGGAPTWPTTRPDTLKVVRAVEDALTGVVWRDDSQVCEHLLRKCYGAADAVYVIVERIEE